MNISTPTLLLDTERCLRNIERISSKARKAGVRFRPHFKTHQSLEIGRWFREHGVDAITVSSVGMAAFFAADGWREITVAFPVNLREIDALNELARTVRLHLLVESAETASLLRSRLTQRCGAFIKIDVGYHRTGIAPDDGPAIEALMAELKGMLTFEGFLTHAGHSYRSRSREEILSVHTETCSVMARLKHQYGGEASVGDTPCSSVAEEFPEIDEIRPGNFVFFDLMQEQIGSCRAGEIAVAMACPVVAKHPGRGEVVIYGGAVHFSKDFLVESGGRTVYGRIVELNGPGWRPWSPGGAVVTALSQEHGVVSADTGTIERLRVGELLGVIPVHSCLTAACMRGYRTLDGRAVDHR